MGLLFTRAQRSPTETSRFPSRASFSRSGVSVTPDNALRQSAVWAAVTLRADLVSTLPLDVFRQVGDMQLPVPTPPVLVSPGGEDMPMNEWLYSSQMDLDRVGNCFGIITELDGAGKPARIDLAKHEDVTVVVKDGEVSYRIKSKTYSRHEIWHEKQYTVAGLPVGLSPIAYAAYSLGVYQSAQEFALTWFANGGTIPSGHLKNDTKVLGAGEADIVKDRFKLAVENRDLFVTGKDWTYSTITAAAADAKFLESQAASDEAAVRFFGVPGDLVGVASKGSAITYANITQRNLQFLIMHLNPVLRRREKALSKLLTEPRFVKFNRAGLLEMDPATQSKVLIEEVKGYLTAPSEARALMNRAPYTPEQMAEFEAIAKLGKTPTSTTTNGA